MVSEFPVQISFHEISHSDAVSNVIQKKAQKLARFYGRIMSCRVVVEPCNRRHHQGNLFRVRISIKVPHGEIVVGREPGEDHAHEDVYVAVRDAFRAARRRLQDFVRTMPHERRRHHAGASIGQVLRVIYEDGGYGFLEADEDKHEVYFHGHSVLNNHFYELKPGSRVRFTEENGEEGPQASTVEKV